MTNKPKVFISSTIYDFSDLRSALKYYLEPLGYEVLLSEYNDFKKDLNANSFEACLKTIEDVQFFILLVGGRVGGYYNKDSKTSITQMEYRKAYEELKKGKLKIVNIVRDNLWNARNERKSLEKLIGAEYKGKYNISDDDVLKIKNYKSDIVSDAEFIFNFIEEISRKEEMKEAQKDPTKYPPGNWVHSFKTFRDVVDILKREFSFTDDLERIAMKENIKYELVENFKIFFSKSESGKLYPMNVFADKVFEIYKGELKGVSSYTKEQLKLFPIYLMIGIGRANLLKTDYIEVALKSGKFLIFDNQLGKFSQSPFSKALQRYKNFIDKLKGLETMDFLDNRKRLELADDIKNKDYYNINNILLFSIYSIYKLQWQIINLSFALYIDIHIPSTLLENYDYEGEPINREIVKDIKAESVTESDLLKYLDDMVEKSKQKINNGN